MDFARTMRIMMMDKDITQVQLADKLSVHKQVINDFLQKKKDYRLNEDICRMASALGYTVRLQMIDNDSGKVLEVD